MSRQPGSGSLRITTESDVQLLTSVETLLMVALGGPGTLAGPAIGAAVIVYLGVS